MILIYTVCTNLKEAEKISQKLIKDKLAACVNYWQINSCYLWQGKMEREQAVALLIKTPTKNYQIVEEKIKELHSDEVPAIFSWPADRAEEKYLQWIKNYEQKNK